VTSDHDPARRAMTCDQLDSAWIHAARMIADLEIRLRTDIAVTASIVRGTDPDSADGREARQMLDRFQQMLDGLGGMT
jgi:hypothetical protein